MLKSPLHLKIQGELEKVILSPYSFIDTCGLLPESFLEQCYAFVNDCWLEIIGVDISNPQLQKTYISALSLFIIAKTQEFLRRIMAN